MLGGGGLWVNVKIFLQGEQYFFFYMSVFNGLIQLAWQAVTDSGELWSSHTRHFNTYESFPNTAL